MLRFWEHSRVKSIVKGVSNSTIVRKSILEVDKKLEYNFFKRIISKIKRVFTFILFAILVGSVAGFFYIFFKTATSTPDNLFIKTLYGGFAGAFFAFLFLKLGEILTKFYNRDSANIKALSRLEHIYNFTLGVIQDNIFIIEHRIEAFDKFDISKHAPPVFFGSYDKIIVEREILLSLTNEIIINEAFSYNASSHKINRSFETLESTYNEIKKMILDRTFPDDEYLRNTERIINALREMKFFLENHYIKTLDILATIRVLLKDKPILSKLMIKLTPKTNKRKYENLHTKELEILKREVKDSKKSSSGEIDAIKNKL